MTILVIFGTRPEAIKLAPVILELKKDPNLEVLTCVSAQHREMLDQVLTFFEIVPDFDLNLMTPNQSLNFLASKLFEGIDQILSKTSPQMVLVHGDTLTSSIAAWASFHRRITIAHVEAGLRTYNKLSPYPEEINRQITGRIADIHFAPTKFAEENLIREGINLSTIYRTGNTVIDALFLGLEKIERGYRGVDISYVKTIVQDGQKNILVTGHRRENFGEGFENLCFALEEIALEKDVQIIYPVHLNPNVKEPVHRILGSKQNVHLIRPVDYPAFIYLMKSAYMIITDSGGVQEEAPSLGKPVLLTRDTTERPEAVAAGTVLMVGTNKDAIVQGAKQLIHDQAFYSKMAKAINPYGDGMASQRILNAIKSIGLNSQ